MPKNVQVITVFTDGACTNNGYHNAKAGIGIHFPNGELADISRIIKKNPTNQRAELYAILLALYYLEKKIGLENKKIMIKTDSEYSINCVTKWINGWKNNDWLKKNGEKVKHKEIISRIDKYIQKYDIEFEHVSAHTNGDDPDSIGNAIADELAKNAWSEYYLKNGIEEEEKNSIKIPKKNKKIKYSNNIRTVSKEEQEKQEKKPKKVNKKGKKDLLDYDPDTVEINLV